MLGFEAALFLPSGTQSNLVGVMTHCARGDEYIVGQEAHTYRYEAGGAAVLGSVQPQPLNNAADGTIPLADIEAAIKPDDAHFARTRLVALENTIGGRVLPAGLPAAVRELADARGLAHAPRRRAAVQRGGEAGRAAAGDRADFDSVSRVPVEGTRRAGRLGALRPREFITDARRWRKMLGGGMRQAGIIAAAGRYAIAHNIARLAEDHENARGWRQGSRGTRSSRWRPRRRTWSSSGSPKPSRSVHRASRGGRRPSLRHGAAALVHASRRRASGRRAAIACVDRFFARRG